MLMTSASLVRQPVVSLRTGEQIALAQTPIINPHNLKIFAWWCKVPGGQSNMVLLSEDVRDVVPEGLAVNDIDSLSQAEDLARHDKILENNFQLMDKVVKTKRHKLGKISDYAYDESLFIQKLYVARSITKLFAKDDLLVIGRTQIIEVTDYYILVRDTEIHAGEEELAGAAEAAVG